jgi:hypothetical protein
MTLTLILYLDISEDSITPMASPSTQMLGKSTIYNSQVIDNSMGFDGIHSNFVDKISCKFMGFDPI